MNLKSRLKKLERKSGSNVDVFRFLEMSNSDDGGTYYLSCNKTKRRWNRRESESEKEFLARIESDVPGILADLDAAKVVTIPSSDETKTN